MIYNKKAKTRHLQRKALRVGEREYNKTAVNSLDIVISRFFMKLFKTNNIDTVRNCQKEFAFELPSVILARHSEHFSTKYKACDNNTFCKLCNRCSLLEFEIVYSSGFRYVLLPFFFQCFFLYGLPSSVN